MRLKTYVNGEFYHFDVLTFWDDEDKKFYFLIALTSGRFMLAEKVRSEKWVQISGNSLSRELQKAITEAIDKTTVNELFANAYLFDELPKLYQKSLLEAEEYS